MFFFGGCSGVGGEFFHTHRRDGTRGGWGLFFGLGDSFTRSGATRRVLMRFLVLWGALLPFVLRVVAGACVGRWTGQPRMPPQERQHEGLGGLGDCFTRSGVDGTPPCGGAGEEGLVFVFLWRLLRCRRGILSHAQERRHEGLGGGVIRRAGRAPLNGPRKQLHFRVGPEFLR